MNIIFENVVERDVDLLIMRRFALRDASFIRMFCEKTGIDPDTVAHIFGRFVRDKQERLIGTGVDLPIVQMLVQQMGGSIEFDSKIGHGSSVWISIPCEAKVIDRGRADFFSNMSENNLL